MNGRPYDLDDSVYVVWHDYEFVGQDMTAHSLTKILFYANFSLDLQPKEKLMKLIQALFQRKNGDIVTVKNVQLTDTGMQPDDPGAAGPTKEGEIILKILVVDDGGQKFAVQNIRLVQTKWHPALFLRADTIVWGSDTAATRLRTCLYNAGIEFFAHILLLDTRCGEYFYIDPNGHRKRMKNYGKVCHQRTLEVARKLGVDPDTDMTNFPWDKLS
jgi:hypothetical protein